MNDLERYNATLAYSSWAHKVMCEGDLVANLKSQDVLLRDRPSRLLDDAIGPDLIRRDVARRAIAKMYELAKIEEEQQDVL